MIEIRLQFSPYRESSKIVALEHFKHRRFFQDIPYIKINGSGMCTAHLINSSRVLFNKNPSSKKPPKSPLSGGLAI